MSDAIDKWHVENCTACRSEGRILLGHVQEVTRLRAALEDPTCNHALAAINNHLCPNDAADWLVCSGHGDRETCTVCDVADKELAPHAGCYHDSAKLAQQRAETAEAALAAAQQKLRDSHHILCSMRGEAFSTKGCMCKSTFGNEYAAAQQDSERLHFVVRSAGSFYQRPDGTFEFIYNLGDGLRSNIGKTANEAVAAAMAEKGSQCEE